MRISSYAHLIWAKEIVVTIYYIKEFTDLQLTN